MILFNKVSKRYEGGKDALVNVNFALDPGEITFLTGHSGAGKSTLFQLLLRFYDPVSGRILVDGVDIGSASPQAVRERIGLVPQETVIFGTTARENMPDDVLAKHPKSGGLFVADPGARGLPETRYAAPLFQR